MVAVASTERHCLHADTVRGISAQMNSRGLFHSSIHVNEVDKACAKELHTISSAAWDCLKRAHESCGRDQPARLLTLFLGIAEAAFCRISGKIRVRAQGGSCPLRWTDLSCQSIELVGKRHLLDPFHGQLAFANHMHEFEAGQDVSG